MKKLFIIIALTSLFNHVIANPKYPQKSIEEGEQGEVVVAIKFDKNGDKEWVKLIKSNGYKRLDDSAMEYTYLNDKYKGKNTIQTIKTSFKLK